MALERVNAQEIEQRVLYSEHIVRYAWAAAFARDCRVLDAGCGEGYGSALLRSAGARVVIGLDRDTETTQEAHKRYGGNGTRYAQGDVAQLPFPDGAFDLIVCFEVIEHLPAGVQVQLLAECARVLTPDGLLLLSSPNRDLYTPDLSRDVLKTNPFHLHELSYNDLVVALAPVFPQVVIVGQNPIPDMLITGDGPFPTDVRYHSIADTLYRVRLIEGSVEVLGGLAPTPAPSFSLYCIAVCGRGPAPPPPPAPLAPVWTLQPLELVTYSLWSRWDVHQRATLDWLRARLAEAERTVIERTAWARTMEEDVIRATKLLHTVEQELTVTHAAYARIHAQLEGLEGQSGVREG